MARDGAPILVRSQVVPRVLRRIAELGADPRVLERRFHLSDDSAARIPLEVPLVVEQKLPDDAAELVGDPFLGVHLAESLTRGAFGLYEFVGRSAGTLGQALEHLLRFLPIMDDTSLIALETRNGEAWLTQRIAGEPLVCGRQANEFTAAAFVLLVRQSLRQPWSLRRIIFAHSSPEDCGELERCFGTRIEFGAGFNALVFGAADLAIDLATSDEALLQVLEPVATRQVAGKPQRGAWIARTRVRLAAMLGVRQPTLESLARALHMSPRTLQRRLAAEHTSFEDLCESVRRELALVYVSDASVSFSEVAFRIGYADASSFGRAFKRWTGKTPKRYRAEALAKAK